MTVLAPVSARERVVTLDILRGGALFGVLAANLYELFSYRFAQRGHPDLAPVDRAADWFMHVAVSSKAQTLLTFLFGFGFAVQLVRARARDEGVLPIYLRRIAALLAIGWFHVLFLAWVDVTWGYALTALFLLPFLRASNRTRLIAAAALTLIPAAIYVLPMVRPTLHFLMFSRPPPAYVAEYVEAARSGDRLAIMHAHATLALMWTFGGGVAWYLPWLLGRFLIGFVAGAQGWFADDGAGHLPLFRRMLVFGGLAGLVGIAILVVRMLQLYDFETWFSMVLAIAAAIGLLGQTAAYVAIVVLLVQRPRWRRVLSIVAPVGRMPLTTYLMQSLICTTLFYGWGFNWDTPRPIACVGLALAIFAVQIAIAHLWLRRFRFGPAEWLWRTIVYWRPQPWRE